MRAHPETTRVDKHAGAPLRAGLCAIVLLSSCANSGPVDKPAPGPERSDWEPVLGRLEKNLAAVKTVRTSVTQVKELAVFSQKVTLTGKIFLENPGKLAWHMDKPLRYSIVIDGAVMRQWDEDTDVVQKTSLSGNPVFKTVSDQLQKWFSGRYSSLKADYEVEAVRLKPSAVMKFTPVAGSMTARAIKHVTVTFRPDERYIDDISVVGVNDDRTTMTFSDTVLDEPIAADAWEVRPRER